MSKNCVIYCRVSTPRQAQEGESLDTQEMLCRRLQKNRKWNLFQNAVFKEPFSGRKNHRPVYDEMIEFIKRNPGKIDFLIVKMIDRLSRDGALQYELMKKELAELGVELVDVSGVIQPTQNALEHLGIEYDWSRHSPSEIAETVMASYGKTEVRNILTRLIGREIELVREGYQIGPANDGFINKKIYVDGKKKTIQTLDEKRAHFFKKMFEMRASGQYTDPQIVAKINAIGFRMKRIHKWDKSHTRIIGEKGGGPLIVKALQRYIQRPIYCGIICENWTKYQPVRAQFDGLIDIETFNKANRGKVYITEEGGKFQILYDYKPEKIKKQVRKYNQTYPYKNVIMCPRCGKPFMGSASKGKRGIYYPAYHCSRKHKYLRIPKQKFEENVAKSIKSVYFNESFLNKLEKTLIRVWRKRQKELLKENVLMNNNVAELTIEKEKILGRLIEVESNTVRKELEKKVDVLQSRIEEAKSQRNSSEIGETDIHEFIKYAKYVMEHPYELLLDTANIQRLQSVFGLVFEELPTYDDVLNGTPKLSPVFQQKRDSSNEESQSVIRLGIEPRTISLKGCCSTS